MLTAPDGVPENSDRDRALGRKLVFFLQLGEHRMVDDDRSFSGEVLFLHTIAMFQAAVMQQLGKLLDPMSGETKQDLAQAKVSIDILEVLKEKTKGNLTSVEEEFLDKVLFELHMNYVDEVKASREKGGPAPKDEGVRTPNEEPGKGSEGEVGP